MTQLANPRRHRGNRPGPQAEELKGRKKEDQTREGGAITQCDSPE